MKKIALWAMCIAVMVLSGCRKAPEWKAEHVFVIGLDGWGAYSCGKGGYAEREGVDGCRMLHVEKTQCTSFIQCCKLGFHVYGGRS